VLRPRASRRKARVRSRISGGHGERAVEAGPERAEAAPEEKAGEDVSDAADEQERPADAVVIAENVVSGEGDGADEEERVDQWPLG
jgi:hypothetical protein